MPHFIKPYGFDGTSIPLVVIKIYALELVQTIYDFKIIGDINVDLLIEYSITIPKKYIIFILLSKQTNCLFVLRKYPIVSVLEQNYDILIKRF